MKAKAKINLLKLAGLSLPVSPIIAIIIANWDKYTMVVPEEVVPASIKLTVGGAVGVTLAVVMSLGKSKLPAGWVLLGILFGLCVLLEPIMADLKLFLGVAFAGATADHIFIKGAVANLEETRVMMKSSDITAEKLASVINKTSGRV